MEQKEYVTMPKEEEEISHEPVLAAARWWVIVVTTEETELSEENLLSDCNPSKHDGSN